MKKITAIWVVAMILSLSVGIVICAATNGNQHDGGTGDAEALQQAPLNPNFVAYWESPPKTPYDHSYGYIPSPMDLSHLNRIPVERLQTLDVLPSSFDWRDSGNVTPVKNQDPCGTCWTFGTTSVLESAVLMGENAEYNFSEQSVALCVDRSWVYLYDETDEPCNAGGWSELASEVFIKKGSVLESCNPYNGLALECDGSCICDDCPPAKRVDGYRLATNNGSEINVIKNAVYDHGPVTMSFYWHSDGNYTDATWGTIYDYYPYSGNTNHLVSIIGWNDSVPHPDPDHDGTGAWIVKNSWDTDWGNDGFFYLAYNSSGVRHMAYFEYKDHDLTEELLYWDEAGSVGALGYTGSSSAWMASVFTTAQSGNLTHVDFWTTSNNAQYEVYVWDGYFGSEIAHQTGSCQEYGYYSIPLSTPIPIDAGQQFTVGVNMTTPEYSYPIPVEFEDPGFVDPPIQSNVSFIRYNASYSWTDLADDYNACLRARMTIEPPDIWVNPTEFDLTINRGDVMNKTLMIGNTGTGVLLFGIHDCEGTPSSTISSVCTDTEKPLFPAGPDANEIRPEGVDTFTPPAALLDTADIHFIYDVEGPSGDSQCLGVEFNGTHFFVTGANSGSDPNKVYIFDRDGNYIRSFNQAYSSGWGWRDLAWDGTYLYGSDDSYVSQFLPNGIYIGDFPGPGVPVCRALAYDPVTDHFWTANWGSDIYEFDRGGNIIHQYSNSYGIFGMAWDDESPDGPWLWVFAQEGSPEVTFYQFDPINGVYTGVSFTGWGSADDLAAGACFTAEWDPAFGILVGLTQNTPDSIVGYEITHIDVPWLSEYPTDGNVTPNNHTNVTVTFNATGLEEGEYNATIIIENNDPDENPVEISVNLTVIELSNCGDVDGSGTVNIMDVRLLMNNVSCSGYPVDPWTGDVTGNGVIDSGDVQLLVAHVFNPAGHLLNCSTPVCS
jgi:C1A family cysteine protease